MKKIGIVILSCFILFGVVGCTDTDSRDETGNKKTEFLISETATVNNTKIKINSVKKVASECSYEYEGKCYSETTPEQSFFLVVDLTIENIGTEELNVSSMLSFSLKDASGEKGKYTLLLKNITSQLDGSVMAGDLFKGQVAYDVKESDKYYFYYEDSLLDSPIKFIINSSDIF